MLETEFTHIDTENGMAMFKGDFAEYKECLIGVVTLQQKDFVSKVAVIFIESDT